MKRFRTAVQAVVTAAGVLRIAAGIVKITGDFRRHGAHEAHSQRCDCFAVCLPCMIDARRVASPPGERMMGRD